MPGTTSLGQNKLPHVGLALHYLNNFTNEDHNTITPPHEDSIPFQRSWVKLAAGAGFRCLDSNTCTSSLCSCTGALASQRFMTGARTYTSNGRWLILAKRP